MALGNYERTGGGFTYLNVYQKNKKDEEGKIVFTDEVAIWYDDENGSDIRYSENKETGVITPVRGYWYEFAEGIVNSVKVDEKNKFGARLEISLSDTDGNYLFCASMKNAYGQSLAERIPHVKIGDKVRLSPYNFLDKNEDGTQKLNRRGKPKRKKGVAVNINDAMLDTGKRDNVQSYFFNGKENLHGSLPFPTDWYDLSTAKQEQYKLEQVIFFSEFINNHFAGAVAETNTPVEEMDLDNI